jgi:hypothetical protein
LDPGTPLDMMGPSSFGKRRTGCAG